MENGNRKQLNFKNIITRIFINCSLLLLFAELILSIHGKAYGYSEQILKNAGWISLDALLLAINLAIIGLMTYKLKSDCPMCKALAFTIITILSIACLSEICFIVYNGRMLTNSYSDALPKWFDAGFAFECIIIAPLALVSLIVTVKTIKTFTCNN